MTPSHWLAIAALLAGGAQAADNGPLARDIFIRGAFNGWGTDNRLYYQGKGVYVTVLQVAPGNHAFKVGSKDWSDEWVIAPAASVAVTTDTDYPMDPHPGPQDTLFVKRTSTYRFSVDVSDLAHPVLRLTQLMQPPMASVDVHRGHRDDANIDYKTFDGRTETVRFSAFDASAPLRMYGQSTSMQLRDPGPQSVSYGETDGAPVVRSGSLPFDALFALAATEMKQDAVSQISDGNYNGGAPVPCECFETGEKWHYVWTRDLSYASNLGLAMLDPQRVRNSLAFKLSDWRAGVPKAPQVAGDGPQIVQDTGSGGSWPVSTDRVSWAFGAEAALQALAPAERKPFAALAYKALANTIENDRIAAWDKASGMYTGEESFLDWRDQSYAAWIVDDIAALASSKALSTNVAHYKALTLTASLAQEHGDTALAARYSGWAADLKKAINTVLWLDDAGMYSSVTAGHLDGAPLHKFDWLGQALAIVTGVADAPRAQEILANYPHGPLGAPVIFPQQQDMPVYHNRAIWPFVTAYGLRAAAMHANVGVADAAYDTLMRGAALNLSNMENLEWLSGQPLLLDEKQPALIGPVIDSRRQLWSVGAYLGMVIENVFGVSTSDDGIRLQPFITAKLRRETFGQSSSITLQRLRLHGKLLTVRVVLPPASRAKGYYPVAAVTLNGAPAGAAIAWSQLGEANAIEITLGALVPGQQGMRHVSADPYVESPLVFGPREPTLALAANRAGVMLGASKGSAATTYNVYRDGQLVAQNLAPGPFAERAVTAGCYAAEAQFVASGNRSHHSAPVCIDTAIEIGAGDARVASNVSASPPDERFATARLKDWGRPGDRFAVSAIRVDKAGSYQLQLRYHNSANQINLGISGGVKWLALKDAAGRVVAQGVVQMPHATMAKSATPPVYSTPLTAQLKPGSYALELTDFYNMSYLQTNASFSAAGGSDGPSNRFDIFGVRLLRTK